MTTTSDIAASVQGSTDAITFGQIEQAAKEHGMTIDEYIVASAAHAAANQALLRVYDQARRGEFSSRSMADIRRDARARFDAENQPR